jgi:hypothetical protein
MRDAVEVFGAVHPPRFILLAQIVDCVPPLAAPGVQLTGLPGLKV